MDEPVNHEIEGEPTIDGYTPGPGVSAFEARTYYILLTYEKYSDFCRCNTNTPNLT